MYQFRLKRLIRTGEGGTIMSKKVETTLYLSDEVVTALKIKAVKAHRKYSDVADELLRQSLGSKVAPKEVKEKK